MKPNQSLPLAFAALTALALTACGGGSSGSTSGPGGIVNMQLTDAPSKDFDHVWVTISEVRFHTSNAVSADDPGWLKYPLPAPVTIDLAALYNGSLSAVLGGGFTLPAGTYQQIRLVLVPDNAPLAASAIAVNPPLTFNDQVNWTDASGVAHVSALEIPAPAKGIGINGSFTVAAGAPLNLVIDFNLDADVVKFLHNGNNAYTLTPTLQYFDLAQSGAVKGALDPSHLCPITAAAAPSGCAYNLVIKAEQLSADSTYHVIARYTTIAADGSFTLYPVRVPAGQSATTVDVLIRGRNMDTILVRGVPVQAGSTPASATAISSAALPLTVDTEYTANASAALTPTGAAVNFYQTLTNTGVAEAPYEVRFRRVNPFTGIFSDAIALSSGPIQLGAYLAGGTPALVSNTPASGNGAFQVFGQAPDYTRTEAGSDPLTVPATSPGAFTIPALAVNASVASADSISGSILQASAGKYDSGYLVVARMGAIVQTLPIASVLAGNGGSGGAYTLANLPGGSPAKALPGAFYYLYARVWNSADPVGTLKRIDFSGYADLTGGSATGMNATLN